MGELITMGRYTNKMSGRHLLRSVGRQMSAWRGGPRQTSQGTCGRQMPTAMGDDPKKALLARRAANDNPFDTYTLRPDPSEGGSARFPILVPSTSDKRMVGCCCEDDYKEIVWFQLEKAKRCDCGYHFKLIDYDPLDPNVSPIFGEGFGSGLTRMY